ncbi:MAG: sulfite exporter TauE/SafE family protein [Alphaproteobacteria bacterium]|nr:sulfite exporter TauE/SafE family protein [Alphaproteobacteria bacterium]
MWADLSLQTLAIVWLGGFLGGIATGAAGFAYGVVASSIWLHAIAPVHVTILVVSIGLIIQAGLTWKMRRSLDMQRLSPFVVAGLIGVPIGVWLVIKTDPSAIKVVLAAFMVAYGVYALAAPRLPRIIGGGKPADAAVGFVGGILGGLAGLSGILPAIWTQIRGWPKDVARGIFQPFIVAMHLATVVLIGVVALDRTGAVLFVAVFPAVLLGAWVGWSIYGKLDERSFQKMFAGLLVVSGVLLMT